ncbi:MAG: TSCPD domain-containing protein [Lachnospirales bacterium]
MRVIGGCSGNLQGVSSLLKGMKAEEAISRMAGIKCGYKNSSCPVPDFRGFNRSS